MLMQKQKSFARSPTLNTVLMIEKAISEHSGEFNKTELWKKLPRKVMWQTYLIALDYLITVNRVCIDKRGILGYIGTSDKLTKLLKNMTEARA